MKVGIVGAGAMGSLFAYFFDKSGIDTSLFEKEKNIISNMSAGINVITDKAAEKIQTKISSEASILAGCEIIIIFVKSYDTDKAIKEISDSVDDSSIIVSLQNGIGNKETIAGYISEERIVYGSTSIGATRVDSSTVKLGGMGNIVIGGKSRKAVELVEGILKTAKLDVTIADNPDIAVWKKAIINAGINPLGALLSVPNGRIIENDYSGKFQEEIVREAVKVAVSLGISLDSNEMIGQTRKVCANTSANLCSMLQDINNRRRTEIDSINGIIINHAKKSNIPVPYNEAIYNLIKAKEFCY